MFIKETRYQNAENPRDCRVSNKSYFHKNIFLYSHSQVCLRNFTFSNIAVFYNFRRDGDNRLTGSS